MIILILIGGAFVFLTLFLFSLRQKEIKKQLIVEEKIVEPAKPTYGKIQVFYGTQTGTAAKMAQSFGEEAIQKGFTPEVIDLKDIKYEHFNARGILSVFFLSNTGQGEAPDNTTKFMKVLKQKEDLDEVRVIDWSKTGYTVFGLGNTQYEFYNKTGKDADALLQKRGAIRVYKLGLGDNNASMQDDYVQWKNDLWEALISYRIQNQLEEVIQIPSQKVQKIQVDNHRRYLSKTKPELANFRFYLCKNESQKMQFSEDDLDFKTKGSLKAQKSLVKDIHQVRQNTKDGSTLQLSVELQNQPFYETAGNIALYPRNDPKIVQNIIQYFSLTQQQLNSYVSVQKVNEDKKLKLNFVPYCKLIDLLESHIDIQGRLTKSILKKIAKFPSNDQNYFVVNSNPKSTPEYKRITEEIADSNDWYYLFRIVKENQIKIGFEDFIDLCDSIAPRLFTIGSSYKKQKNVVVMASILENGLISKFFNSKPQKMRAQLKKSSFNDAMKWNKVIFISAGTGFAPFRGYLQQKQILMQRAKNAQKVHFPKVTLFFGCKTSNSDFIYRDEIQGWVLNQVINVFHAAFSREKQQKIYVQHLLAKQEKQITEYLEDENAAIYICGSVGMGHQVSEVIASRIGHQKVKQLQLKGRIIKQLW